MHWDFLLIANPVWETARLVERIPEAAEHLSPDDRRAQKAAGKNVFTDGGGSALNTACALAMAGRRVLAVGRVGDDEQGRASLAALRRRGVETACEIVPGRTTKRNTCYVEAETHATAFAVDVPGRSVPPWGETPDQLLDARVLLLDRLAAGAPAWLRARTEARGRIQKGERPPAQPATLPVNAFVRNSAVLSPGGAERFLASLPHLGYLQVPEDPKLAPASRTCGPNAAPGAGDRAAAPDPPSPLSAGNGPERNRVHRPRDLAPLADSEVRFVLGQGVGLLVRTRGAQGALVHVAGQPDLCARARPTLVVDPTGAGDAFAAGFLDALLEGLSIEDAVGRAVDWGARACRYLGARAWLDHEPPPRRA